MKSGIFSAYIIEKVYKKELEMKRAFYETEVMFVKRQLRHLRKDRDALKESVKIAAGEIIKLQDRSPEEVGTLISSLINAGRYTIRRRNYKK